jgi:hypothetical protein
VQRVDGTETLVGRGHELLLLVESRPLHEALLGIEHETLHKIARGLADEGVAVGVSRKRSER